MKVLMHHCCRLINGVSSHPPNRVLPALLNDVAAGIAVCARGHVILRAVFYCEVAGHALLNDVAAAA